MGNTILSIIFLLPVYAVLIWTYIDPEESMKFGSRWQYKGEPEYSDLAIAYTKFGSMFVGILLTFILALSIIENHIIRVLLFVSFIFFILFTVFRFRKWILEE